MVQRTIMQIGWRHIQSGAKRRKLWLQQIDISSMEAEAEKLCKKLDISVPIGYNIHVTIKKEQI